MSESAKRLEAATLALAALICPQAVDGFPSCQLCQGRAAAVAAAMLDGTGWRHA